MTTSGISVVVLAGGRSRRFGRDKLAEPVHGRPLVQHAIDAVRPIATEIVVVAAPGAHPALPGDVRLVNDPVAFEGPLAGLIGGLAAARSPTVVLVGGDMPSLSAAVLGSMAALLLASDADAMVLEDDGGARPLPMALRREQCLATASALFEDGERRLRALIEAMSTAVLPEVAWRAIDPAGDTLRDVDVEADLT